MISNRRAQREAKQLFHLCVVNGLLDEARARQVAQFLLAAGYRNCPAVLAQFLRLVRLDVTQHTADIGAAAPLPPELQASIEASLARRYGAGLAVTFANRPSLIGGVRIQVGSDVYDGRILAKLAALEKSF